VGATGSSTPRPDRRDQVAPGQLGRHAPRAHHPNHPPRPRAASFYSRATARRAGSALLLLLLLIAQQRLHRTWRRLERRAKRRTIIAVAVARELAGFCWAIARTE
jgi:hypothetical protein